MINKWLESFRMQISFEEYIRWKRRRLIKAKWLLLRKKDTKWGIRSVCVWVVVHKSESASQSAIYRCVHVIHSSVSLHRIGCLRFNGIIRNLSVNMKVIAVSIPRIAVYNSNHICLQLVDCFCSIVWAYTDNRTYIMA